MDRPIALFMPSLGGGGAERAMLNLAGGLIDSGFRVDLILASARGPYLDQVPAGVRVIDLAVSRALKCLPGVVRYLRATRPQVMVTTPFRVNILAIVAKLLTGSRVRVFIREAATMSVTLRNYKPWQAWTGVRLARYFYPHADGIIGVSQGVADDLRELLQLDPAKLRAIYNPVVNRTLEAMADEPAAHPWFAAGAPPVILGVGRLAPQKDFTTLIRAYAQIAGRSDARLMILGEGPERSALQQLVEELGLTDRVALPGFVANPFPCMRQAALLVLSSRHEGLPNVLIQAMALGTPVVATDCPSGPDEILDHGRYGPLVPIGDPDALAAAMAAVLERRWTVSERQQLIDRSDIYRVEKVMEDYLDFFFPALGVAGLAPGTAAARPLMERGR